MFTLDYSYQGWPDVVAHDYYIASVEEALVLAFRRAHEGDIPLKIARDERVLYDRDALHLILGRMRAMTAGGMSPKEAATRIIHESGYSEENRVSS